MILPIYQTQLFLSIADRNEYYNDRDQWNYACWNPNGAKVDGWIVAVDTCSDEGLVVCNRIIAHIGCSLKVVSSCLGLDAISVSYSLGIYYLSRWLCYCKEKSLGEVEARANCLDEFFLGMLILENPQAIRQILFALFHRWNSRMRVHVSLIFAGTGARQPSVRTHQHPRDTSSRESNHARF